MTLVPKPTTLLSPAGFSQGRPRGQWPQGRVALIHDLDPDGPGRECVGSRAALGFYSWGLAAYDSRQHCTAHKKGRDSSRLTRPSAHGSTCWVLPRAPPRPHVQVLLWLSVFSPTPTCSAGFRLPTWLSVSPSSQGEDPLIDAGELGTAASLLGQ